MTERMTALLRRASEGDREAESVLVSENSGLIHTIARRYFGRGAEPDDLYQLACVGFIKAVRGFDPARGNEFSTYAVPKIAGEIRRFLRDDGAVKVSRSMKERAQGIRTARTRLEQTLGHEPTLSELAAETGLEPEEIAAAETATGPTESLQRENGETGFTLEHTLGDYEQETRMVEYADLREALRRLPERERQVIALRFYHGLTQQRAAVGLEGGAIGPQHVAEHPRHSAVIRPPGQHTEGAAVRMQEQVRVDLVAEAGHSGGIESDAVAEGPVQLIRQNRYIFLAAENIAEGQTQEFYILLRRKLPDLIHCVLHRAPAFLSWLHTSADRGFCCPV